MRFEHFVVLGLALVGAAVLHEIAGVRAKRLGIGPVAFAGLGIGALAIVRRLSR